MTVMSLETHYSQPQERNSWRSDEESAMLAASQLPGRGPTDVDNAPVPAC